jgi:hypothetical protein
MAFYANFGSDFNIRIVCMGPLHIADFVLNVGLVARRPFLPKRVGDLLASITCLSEDFRPKPRTRRNVRNNCSPHIYRKWYPISCRDTNNEIDRNNNSIGDIVKRN